MKSQNTSLLFSKISFLFFFIFIFFSCSQPRTGYNILDYDAKGDSMTMNTYSIQKAIDEASKYGGGEVVIPCGIYLTGTLVLKSNVTLKLEKGAKLLGSKDHDDYKPFMCTVGAYKQENRHYLIYARNASNIAITGYGTIDGNGDVFWESYDTLPRWIKPLKGRVSNMIELVECSNVRIENVTLTHSPEWTLHLFDCDEVFISKIRLINNLYGPNNDGIDLSGCRKVMISDCYIKTCDDAICLKTFANSRTTHDITVTNCIMQTTCVALKLGETYKDIHDVVFTNCVITGSSRAIGIYATEGGHLYNININNIVCNTNAPLVLNRPIQISQFIYEGEKKGRISNVSISNFTTTTQGRIMITANDTGCIKNIRLQNLNLMYPLIEDPKLYASAATSSQFKGMELDVKEASAAIVIKNVQGFSLQDVQINWPSDNIPSEWKFSERIENGSSRVHKPSYEKPRGTEFNLLWARNVRDGLIEAPQAMASSKSIPKYDIKESSIRLNE